MTDVTETKGDTVSVWFNSLTRKSHVKNTSKTASRASFQNVMPPFSVGSDTNSEWSPTPRPRTTTIRTSIGTWPHKKSFIIFRFLYYLNDILFWKTFYCEKWPDSLSYISDTWVPKLNPQTIKMNKKQKSLASFIAKGKRQESLRLRKRKLLTDNTRSRIRFIMTGDSHTPSLYNMQRPAF